CSQNRLKRSFNVQIFLLGSWRCFIAPPHILSHPRVPCSFCLVPFVDLLSPSPQLSHPLSACGRSRFLPYPARGPVFFSLHSLHLGKCPPLPRRSPASRCPLPTRSGRGRLSLRSGLALLSVPPLPVSLAAHFFPLSPALCLPAGTSLPGILLSSLSTLIRLRLGHAPRQRPGLR